MILADTSTWVQHFRDPSTGLGELLLAGWVAMHPWVRLEVSLGAPPRRRRTLALMSQLEPLPVATAADRSPTLTPHDWLVYCVAAIGLSITPGPNSFLVLTHGALHGHRRTLWTVAGGALGFSLLIGLSLAGIGALLQASSHALTVLKWLGGAYLVWLGVQLWRAPPPRLDAATGAADSRAAVLFRQGLLTAVSNPKALLFYGAFLPQLIRPGVDLLSQLAALLLVFVAIEIVVEYALALLAHRVRPFLARQGRRFNRVCGSLFIGMGAALPMAR